MQHDCVFGRERWVAEFEPSEPPVRKLLGPGYRLDSSPPSGC